MSLRTKVKILQPLIAGAAVGAVISLNYIHIDQFYLLLIAFMIGVVAIEVLKHLEQ